jgi:hypothetical protein
MNNMPKVFNIKNTYMMPGEKDMMMSYSYKSYTCIKVYAKSGKSMKLKMGAK